MIGSVSSSKSLALEHKKRRCPLPICPLAHPGALGGSQVGAFACILQLTWRHVSTPTHGTRTEGSEQGPRPLWASSSTCYNWASPGSWEQGPVVRKLLMHCCQGTWAAPSCPRDQGAEIQGNLANETGHLTAAVDEQISEHLAILRASRCSPRDRAVSWSPRSWHQRPLTAAGMLALLLILSACQKREKGPSRAGRWRGKGDTHFR